MRAPFPPPRPRALGGPPGGPPGPGPIPAPSGCPVPRPQSFAGGRHRASSCAAATRRAAVESVSMAPPAIADLDGRGAVGELSSRRGRDDGDVLPLPPRYILAIFYFVVDCSM